MARCALELGGAVAALKQSIPGDFAIVDLEEVEDSCSGFSTEPRAEGVEVHPITSSCSPRRH